MLIFKYLTPLFFLNVLLFNAGFSQNVGIGATGFTPNASSILELQATNKGMLVPRMTAAQRTALNPLPAAAQGLLVYQTDGAQGFYYNTSTTTTPAWTQLTNDGWSLTGNSGTTVGTNFLGTTDAVDFAIYTNNAERIRVQSGGDVGINTTTPSQTLDVAGDVEFGGGAAKFDGTDEFVNLDAESESWYLAVRNTALTANADFHIGLTQAEDGIFHIQPDGNIGIGTTAPGQKLEVAGIIYSNASASSFLMSDRGTNGHFSGLQLLTAGTATWTLGSRNSANENLYLWNETNGGSSLFIESSTDEIGIGNTDPKSKLHVTGSFGVEVKPINNGDSPYTAGDEGVILVDAGAGAVTVNLPAAASVTDRIYTIKKTDATNVVTIDGNGAELVEGNTTYTLTNQFEGVTIISDGTAWYIAASETQTVQWSLTGNSGTTVGTNFLGTTDAIDFALYTNNSERIRVESGGHVGIGVSNPEATLHIDAKTANEVLRLEGDGLTFMSFHEGANRRAYLQYNTTSNVYSLVAEEAGSQLTLNTANSEQVRIDASGNVGIGETSPSQKLEVVGNVLADGGSDAYFMSDRNASGNNSGLQLLTAGTSTWSIGSRGASDESLNIYDEDGGASRMFFHESSGFIGVGNTNPTSRVHVTGSFGVEVVAINNASSPYTAADEGVILANAGAGAITINLPAASGVTDRIYTIKKTDASNNITIDANGAELIDGSATHVLTNQYESVTLVCDGSAWYVASSEGNGWGLSGNSGTTVGTNFIGTTDGTDFATYTNNSERMRITSGGNFGIGVTVPARKFHIHDGADAYLAITTPNSGSSAGDGLELSSNSDLGANMWNWENGYIRFATNNAERMRILAGGNIGIGETSPSEKLEVVGNILADGTTDAYFKSDRNATGNNSGLQLLTAGTARWSIGSRGASDESLNIYDEDGAASRMFFHPTSGNVGVSTTNPLSKLHAGGSMGTKVKAIAAGDSPYTAGDEVVILAHAAAGAITINLPAVAGVTDRVYLIKKTDATNNVTIDPSGAELIDGAATLVLTTQYESVNIVTDGSAWYVVSEKGSGGGGADGNGIYDGSGSLTAATTVTQGANNMIFDLTGTGDFDIQDNGTSALFIKDDGSIGINDNTPGAKVDIAVPNTFFSDGLRVINDGFGDGFEVQHDNTSSSTVAGRFRCDNNNKVAIFQNQDNGFTTTTGVIEVRRRQDGKLVEFDVNGTEQGDISVASGTVSYNAFTGSHYGFTSKAIEEKLDVGLLVSMTGKNLNDNDSATCEIVYGFDITNKANDPSTLGSYLSLSKVDSATSNNVQLIMAVGNGVMWIAENGENIVPGDYLISSNVPGHAMKDLQQYETSYIVAKAAEPINWDNVEETINGVKHKKISVLFEVFKQDNLAVKISTLSQELENYKHAIEHLSAENESLKIEASQLKSFKEDTDNRLKILETLLIESNNKK